MGYCTLEVNLISGRGLKHVNLFSKMDVYALVSVIGGEKKDEQKTPVDSEGNTNPTWDIPLKFSLDKSVLEQNRLTLEFILRCDRSLGDKDVGQVNIPIKELLDGAKESTTRVQFVRYQVRKPSGKPKGELSFSYKFDQKKVETRKGVEKVEEKVKENTEIKQNSNVPRKGNMYPSLYEITGTEDYHPTVPVVGYSNLPVSRYDGYPQPYYITQPWTNYGYPQIQQYMKNNFGLGLEAGLLGGAFGRLLTADFVSDAGSYDQRFSN